MMLTLFCYPNISEIGIDHIIFVDERAKLTYLQFSVYVQQNLQNVSSLKEKLREDNRTLF